MTGWFLGKFLRWLKLDSERKMRVDLRRGERTLGALVFEADRKPLLEHQLSFEQLRMRPQVSAVDQDGNVLALIERVVGNRVDALLLDASRSEKAAVHKDAFGFLDTEDPQRLAGLRTVLTGASSVGYQPLTPGALVLELGPFEKVRIFGNRVLRLYADVDGWIVGTSLRAERHDHMVTEEMYGSYHIPELEVKRSSGEHVASLVPMGASVIAAEGRVEIVGGRGREPLVYLAAGGPQIDVMIGTGQDAIHTSRRVFKDVTSEGWYWLEDVRLGRARLLDSALFRDLIRAVSDLYEL